MRPISSTYQRVRIRHHPSTSVNEGYVEQEFEKVKVALTSEGAHYHWPS
jgi:hypothetical protein